MLMDTANPLGMTLLNKFHMSILMNINFYMKTYLKDGRANITSSSSAVNMIFVSRPRPRCIDLNLRLW